MSCSGRTMLHLLQSWSPAEVPGLSWGNCSGGQYLNWGPQAGSLPWAACALCHRVRPRRRSWRVRDRQPQQSVLLRGSFQGSVLLGIKQVSLFCFPFSAGFSHLPNGLYPSYIPLSHLEPPSAGSPLLAQLGQHSLFESQKGEFGDPVCPSHRSPQGTYPVLWACLAAGCWSVGDKEKEPHWVISQG